MLQNSLIQTVDLIQGSQEWLNFRKGKIGSSMAASIMGKGFRTPLQLFEDIVEDRQVEVNDAMRRGTRLEPIARAWLDERFACNLEPAVIEHPNPDYRWHFSSVDGIWQNPVDGGIFVVEIKCPGKTDHQTALDGNVPEKYLPQCYHILEDLHGVHEMLYFSYTEESQALVWVSRNEYEMATQFAEELSFYSRLLNFRPPEPTDKDWVEIYSQEALSKANTYSFIMDQIEVLQEQASKLKQEMIQSLESNRAKIGNLKIQKVVRAGAVDYSKIEALQGIDLEPYRKEAIVSWRISS